MGTAALLRAAPLAGPACALERFFEVVDPIRWPARRAE